MPFQPKALEELIRREKAKELTLIDFVKRLGDLASQKNKKDSFTRQSIYR